MSFAAAAAVVFAPSVAAAVVIGVECQQHSATHGEANDHATSAATLALVRSLGIHPVSSVSAAVVATDSVETSAVVREETRPAFERIDAPSTLSAAV